MINSENLTNRPAFQYKNVTGKLTTEFYGKVSTKLVRAGSLLQGTLAIRKANLVEKKKIREGQKRDRFEDRLEANPNVEKNKNFINRIPRPGSGVSVLGWFKNFIGSVALGFFATKLLGSLPLFQGILKGVLGVADFVASTGVFLVNAITTFIDIGYKAYDSTAGFLKAIGGDNAITIFDTFTDRLSSLIDVIIVASIVRGGGLGLGIGGPGAGLGLGSSAARAARARKQEEIRAAKDALDAQKPVAKPKAKKGGSAPAAAAGERERQRKQEEEKRRKTEERDKAIQKRLDEREQQRVRQAKLLRSTSAFRQRQKSIKGISIENRKKLARAARLRRQTQLLSTDAGRRSFELDRFLGQGGITTDPEYKLFKRINALDRVIEKNQVEGNSAAARRNIKERDILFKKLQKGQTLRQRGGRVTPVEGIGRVKRLIRKRADTRFLTGLEPDPKLMSKAFADAQADFDADQEVGIRGGRVARDTSGMSRLDRAVSRVPVGVTARGLARLPDRLILKLFGRRVARLAGRLPFIGGLVDFGISLLEGDPIPKAATRAIFAGIGGGVGAFLGSLTGPFAPIAAPIGALLVGGLADSLGSFLYDSIIKGFFPSASNDAGGNILTNALKPIGEFFGGLWGRINEFLFGKPPSSLDELGTFIQDRPGYKKSDGTTPPPPLTPPPPKKLPPPFLRGKRKAPTGGDVDVSGFKLPKDVAGDKDFIAGINRLAKKYQISPNDLLSVIAFETGGSFSPSQKNLAGSGATGLIQFTEPTAKGLGTTTEDLAKMSRSEQLKFVDKYFSNKGIKGGSLSDLYMSVLFPVAVGKPDSFVLFGRGALPGYTGRAYDQNRGLDLNNDGSITKGEASFKVIQTKKRYEDIKKNASYEKSDSTVIIKSSDIASNNITPVPIPTNNNVPVIASSGGDGYDPFQSTYKIG